MMKETIAQLKAVMQKGQDIADFASPDAPCTEDAIKSAESAMGRRLPSALVELLRFSSTWLWRERGFDAVMFCAPEEMVKEYFAPEEEDYGIFISETRSPRAKPYYYSSKRIMFAHSDHHYYRFQIDEDPAESGVIGQVVVIDADAETIDVIADSLEAFVLHGIECLERQISGGYPADST